MESDELTKMLNSIDKRLESIESILSGRYGDLGIVKRLLACEHKIIGCFIAIGASIGIERIFKFI